MEKAGSEGPAERCFYLNNLFMKDETRRHLIPSISENGYRAYVSRDCVKLIERFENLLQAQNKDGSFKEKPEDVDDHSIDAGCYLSISRIKWVHPDILKQRRGIV